MPLFSVIIPTYNRRELLAETLESVRAQRFLDFEVVVVDDGSSDGTLAYLDSLKDRVRVLQQDNRGPGGARNLGLRQATGDYVAFLDSDDLWFPWSLQSYASVIAAHERPSFIAGRPLRFQSGEPPSGAEEAPLRSHRFDDYLASGDEWRWWGVSSFVLQREAAQGVGGFAEQNMNGEDADLALRLGTAPGFVQVTSPFTFAYREHASNVTLDLGKSLAGVWHKITSEKRGGYPGGDSRRRERWRILTRHARPVMLSCLQAGRCREAWRMYRAVFRWHLALGRWKFLLGFPLASVFSSR